MIIVILNKYLDLSLYLIVEKIWEKEKGEEKIG